MRILERNVYVGPSMYAHFPVIKLLLDLGALEEWPSGQLGCRVRRCAGGGAARRLHEHGCSYREPGGLIRRMREDEGTWLGHVLEHVAIELQNIAGEDVSFGKTRSTDVPRRVHGGLRVRAARRGHRRGRAAHSAAVRAVAGSAAARRHRARGLELAGAARRVHPLRAAPRARSFDRIAGARRRRSATSPGCA